MLKKSAGDVNPVDITDRIEFAAAMTAVRESASLTVRDLAKAAGVPTATASGYLSGRHLPNPNQPEALLAMLAACGVPERVQAAWLATLRRIWQAPGRRSARVRSPYPGLASFQPEDAVYFFGRGELIADIRALLVSLRRRRSAEGMIVLTGPSGSGKSSVLRAGVIAQVTRAGVRALTLTPGEDPVAALTTALSDGTGLTAVEVEELFERTGAPLPLPADGPPLLLVVDQAEEMFTACDATQRATFLTRLRDLTEAVDPSGTRRVVVILALRADFYAAAADEPVLLPALRHAQIVVGAMSREQLREAIVAPAAAVGLHVEEALVATLLDDLAPRDRPGSAHDRGALPLLAHALHATWLISRRGRMTVDDYQATGGISRAVEHTAETVWGGLDDRDREIARRVFLRLVFVDDESAVTRRRVRLDELRGLDEVSGPLPAPKAPATAGDRHPAGPDLDDGGTARTAAEVVELFADARLLTLRTDTVEISHEALISAWGRLRTWIDADRSALRAHRQLADAARTWQRADRDDSYLLRSGRLAVARELLGSGRVALNDTEQAFIDASARQVDRRRAAERRQRRRLRVALAAVAVLAVAASGLSVVAWRAEASANLRAAEAASARDDAQSRELAIAADRLRDGDPALAAQLSLVAYRVAPTVDARSALLDSTAVTLPTRVAAEEGPTFVAVDRTRSVMAVTQAASGALALWSIADPRRPAHLTDIAGAQPTVQQFSVAISPDGRQVAAGGAAGLVERWDIGDPRHPRRLDGPGVVFPSGVLALVFSPDGRQLAAGGAGGAILRWSIDDAGRATELPKIPEADLVSALAWSPDSRTLWAGDGDGAVNGWTVSDGGVSTSNASASASTAAGAALLASEPAPIRLATGPAAVSALAVSPDGALLVAGTKRGEPHAWRRDPTGRWTAVTPSPPRLAGWLDSISFTPDGAAVALGGTGNEIRILGTDDLAEKAAMTTPGPVTAVVFARDGTLATGSSDGYARLWPVPGPVIGPLADYVYGLTTSGNGRLIVGPAAKAGVVLSYDLRDRNRPAVSSAKPSGADIRLAGVVAASPDGAVIAEGSADGRVQLWDAADPRHPRAVGSAFPGAPDYVDSLAFSADGTVLAVGSDAQVIDLWNVADPARPVRLFQSPDTGGQVAAVRFQPGGPLLAAGTTAGTVQVWNVADPARPRRVAELNGLTGYVWSADFSRDGSILAAAGSAREIRLWDVRDPAAIVPIGTPITGPVNDIGTVRFSPAGTELAAATYSGVVWVWDLANPARPELRVKARAADGVLYGLAWSPDGSTFSAGGSAQRIWSWTADAEAAAREVCAAAGAGISEREWRLYVHDLPYNPPCA
jgi:WD40 repeat protein/transcriptional regulator with XRE-family HTH domain